MTIFNPFYKALAYVGLTDPIHPAFAHMPIGLVAGALVFGFAALIWKHPLWGISARHCLVLAWLFLFPTVLFGFMDWQHYYHGVWLFPIKAKIGLASFLFVVLSTGVIMIYKGREESKAMLAIYAVSFCTVVLLGYFGGHLVFGGRSPEAGKKFQAGRKIFDENCSACHPQGRNAVMSHMPIQGSDKLSNFETFLAYIRHPRLDNGAKGPMPDWLPSEISDRQARDLYDYVKKAFGEKKTGG
jgi:uncharacterized membrane protein